MKITHWTESCLSHNSYEISISVEAEENQREIFEGALDGFFNSFGCTVCFTESVNKDINSYVESFVDEFLPGFLPVADEVARQRVSSYSVFPIV